MPSQTPGVASLDSFRAKASLPSHPHLEYFSLAPIRQSYPGISRWPLTKLIFLENLLRHEDGVNVTKDLIERFVASSSNETSPEIPFYPSRVLMQDYAGISALVDFAGLRDEIKRQGGFPELLVPATPVDLVVDHSLQVIAHGTSNAAVINLAEEFKGNRTRYEFLRWAEQSISRLRVVPPGRGIVHQINVEALSTGARITDGAVHFDSVVGTDSHTPMVNGLGILGWGVGGIEALAVMLGQPVWLPTPRVIGVKLSGSLQPGVYAADVALSLAHYLRKVGVVGAFLEFFGPGVDCLSVFDRATIANMTPEYGATCSLFASTEATLRYFESTHEDSEPVRSLRAYLAAQGMLSTAGGDRMFDEVLDFDLAAVAPSIAGPRRPHELRPLSALANAFQEVVPKKDRPMASDGVAPRYSDGTIAIAAITSCTNTANPKSMIAAGLLAQNAARLGITIPAHVKCSLTPGSVAVERYLAQLGLLDSLEKLGFHVAGYGCATCVGNSGELVPELQDAIDAHGISAAAVLSGNRNFDSRIHPAISANFLMSPPLVIAMAIAGTVNISLENEPLAQDAGGAPVYLHDLLPDDALVSRLFDDLESKRAITASSADLFAPSEPWQKIVSGKTPTFPWKAKDTYFRQPDFLRTLLEYGGADLRLPVMQPLLVLGDDITTDHISPVGRIHAESDAGRFLRNEGVAKADFNTYGARRGNSEVMIRGIFDNPRIRNELIDTPGPFVKVDENSPLLSIYEASRKIEEAGHGAIVIAGKNYGSGSARDWAAKGQRLLGVKAVIAQSFERIHRTNLVMFGVAPILFSAESLAALKAIVTPCSRLSIDIPGNEKARPRVRVCVKNGEQHSYFDALLQVDTSNEYKLLAAGGLLAAVKLL